MKISAVTQNVETSKQVINIGRGLIHYNIQGKGPVVCLMSTLSGSWIGQTRLLREQYTVLTYDMRGFGDSVNYQTGFPSNEEQAEDLKIILDHMGLQDITLVGLSHGGAVAQHFAVNFPEYLKGLVIVSSFARSSGSTSIFLKVLHSFLEQGDLSKFWELLRAFLYSAKNFSFMTQKEKALKRLMFNQYTAESLEHIYACSLRHDTTQILPKINVPSLIIGGKEDMLFPPFITTELTELIPNAKEVLLETAHIPPIEDPEGFCIILKEFMSSLYY